MKELDIYKIADIFSEQWQMLQVGFVVPYSDEVKKRKLREFSDYLRLWELSEQKLGDLENDKKNQ